MLTIHVRSGQREYITWDLESGGDVIDLSSVDHVSLITKDINGLTTTYSSAAGSPQVYVADPGNGTVEFRPAATDFLSSKSPYYCYFAVFTTSVRWYAIPSDDSYFKILVEEA